MRAALCTHPKVLRMAREIESRKDIGKQLSTGFGGALREIVTRDVTRDVTLASLLRVWSAANEHTTDGVWHGIDLADIDHIAGLPGFGEIMGVVGWAMFDAENQTVTFPNFLEYNAPAKEGRGTGAAERQRRYREKQREKSDVTRDVTVTRNGDVTRDAEKRREELPPPKPPDPPASPPVGGRKMQDCLPTTPQAIRLAGLFHRKLTTPWTAKEVKAFKALHPIDIEELELVATYTELQRARGEDGRHRRDLCTLLNNFTTEVDRAREAGCKPQPSGNGFLADWPGWLEAHGHAPTEYQFAPEFLKTDFHAARKARTP